MPTVTGLVLPALLGPRRERGQCLLAWSGAERRLVGLWRGQLGPRKPALDERSSPKAATVFPSSVSEKLDGEEQEALPKACASLGWWTWK